MQIVSAITLKEMGCKALSKAGVRKDIINYVIDGLIWTSLRGIDSHGIRLLPHYVKGVIGGRLNPDPDISFQLTTESTGILDADHTFGHVAGVKAMDHAIDLAEKIGVGAVSVKNSSHCGALSFFAKAAAKKSMLGLAFTHATPRLKSPGSNRAFFGNNPICFVAPIKDDEIFCFDSATSVISFNAVKAAAAEGRSLSPGMVADINGYETTDPKKAEQLISIGDYKGFGISMMVDILCAIISGMPSGNNVSQMFGNSMSEKRRLGQFYCAIRIDAFRKIDEFKLELDNLAKRVRNEPVIDSNINQIVIPGDKEKITFDQRSIEGIPVTDSLFSEIEKLT